MTEETVRASILVSLALEEAFDRFVDLGRWWPLAYTFGEARFDDAGIDARHWYETDVSGQDTSWGETRIFDRPHRLVLAFGIGADRRPESPESSSEVEVRFREGENGTRIDLEHRAFERHGDGADTLRAGMASPRGWELILAEFARSLRR